MDKNTLNNKANTLLQFAGFKPASMTADVPQYAHRNRKASFKMNSEIL